MSTQTFAQWTPAAGGAGLPAPRLRALRPVAGPIPITLFDGSQRDLAKDVRVVLAGMPDALFAPELEAEIRLFRYARAKSRTSVRPNPGRWAALPHVEGGANPYAASSWLGSLPATGGTTRLSRILLAGLGHGDTVSIVPLLTGWMMQRNLVFRQTATLNSQVAITASTWRSTPGYISASRGHDRNLTPVRFGVAFVGRNERGLWDLLSPITKFAVTHSAAPIVWNFPHPDNVPGTPGTTSGGRVYVANTKYDVKKLDVRLTDSEWLAGWS